MEGSAKHIVDQFGGMRKLAIALGHKHPTTVQRWLKSGTIPVRHHQDLFDLSKRLGVKIDASDFLFFDTGKSKTQGAA